MKLLKLQYREIIKIQGDSKRWTQFRTPIFPELYMVCEIIYITFERGSPNFSFSSTTAGALA